MCLYLLKTLLFRYLKRPFQTYHQVFPTRLRSERFEFFHPACPRLGSHHVCGWKRKLVSSLTAMFVAIPSWEQYNLIQKGIRLGLLKFLDANSCICVEGLLPFYLYIILVSQLALWVRCFLAISVNNVVDAFISSSQSSIESSKYKPITPNFMHVHLKLS